MASAYEAGTPGFYKTDINFHESPSRYRVSWGAVLAGTAVALAVQLTLSLLGLAIGLGLINPATDQRFASVGIGADIWMIVSALISLFAGGWVAARLAGHITPFRGLLHGIVMWAFASLLTFYLMTSAVGTLISEVAGVVGKCASLTAAGVAAVAPQGVQGGVERRGISPEALLDQAKDFMARSGRPGAGPAGGAEDLRQALATLFSPEGINDPEARDAAVNVLTERTTMSSDEASRIVDNWITSYRRIIERAGQAKEGALITAEQAAKGLSKAALLGFVVMILGGGAAAAGGWLGGSQMPAEAAAAREREQERKTAA